MALLDALARHAGLPLWRWLSGQRGPAPGIETDITLPILPPTRMVELARHWAALGFRSFKVKVGRSLADDLAALNAIAGAVPGAHIRADANCGFTAAEALRLVAEVERLGFQLECLEQPCAVEDVAGAASPSSGGDGIPLADRRNEQGEDSVGKGTRRGGGAKASPTPKGKAKAKATRFFWPTHPK
jgi:L-alanine-DL-glutamate epimerase-like enolase superfamily enzyme